MDKPETEVVECDLLIVGGGMAGCGAAYEAAYWAKAKGLRVVLVEKAAVERSGAVAMGLSAINCYMGMKWGENQPEDFVRYVRQDLMGLSPRRPRLRHRAPRRLDRAHVRGVGPAVLQDARGPLQARGPLAGDDPRRVLQADRGRGGQEGHRRGQHLRARSSCRTSCSTRTIRAGWRAPSASACATTRSTSSRRKAVISSAGGATMVFRPHSVGEGLGRIWYAPWNTGSAYKLMIMAGAEMTQMEHRLVVTRFKDGYGPVGHVVPAVQGDLEERLWRAGRGEVG